MQFSGHSIARPCRHRPKCICNACGLVGIGRSAYVSHGPSRHFTTPLTKGRPGPPLGHACCAWLQPHCHIFLVQGRTPVSLGRSASDAHVSRSGRPPSSPSAHVATPHQYPRLRRGGHHLKYMSAHEFVHMSTVHMSVRMSVHVSLQSVFIHIQYACRWARLQACLYVSVFTHVYTYLSACP